VSTSTTLTTTDPVASHRWEQQFKVKGERPGPPPPEKLRERIAELEKAIADAEAGGRRPVSAWAREIEWRRRQLAG
jgi:hypothetical protein